MTQERSASVTYELSTEDGSLIRFESDEGDDVRARSADVVSGKTYPHLPFVEDVRVVIDMDGGCGAAAVHFGRHHPDAQIHAFEADDDAHAHLAHNVADLANVYVHATDEALTAGAWSMANVDRIDVVKVDVDDARVAMLAALGDLLATVKVLYVQYGSRTARRALSELMDGTHELYRSLSFLDHGNSIYLRRDLADHPDANRRLLELFAGGAGF